MTTSRPSKLFLGVTFLIAVAPFLAHAHAVLLTAVPAAGSVVVGPAFSVSLKFNTRVDAKRSKLTLVTPDNRLAPLSIGSASAPDTLVAPADHFLPGEYKLRWQVLAADGHITRGEIGFRVR